MIVAATDVTLAYVYFEREPGRRNMTGRLPASEALKVAHAIDSVAGEQPRNGRFKGD